MELLNEQDYRRLTAYVKTHLGIHLGAEKKALVQSRLHQTLEHKKFTSYAQFYEYVTRDATGDALRELAERLTTNHTYFMRENEHFEYLKQFVLPQLERTVPSRDLGVWSAGCSYGQEAYTLAMIMSDYFGMGKQWDTTVLATDISPRALEEAKRGVYKEEDALQLPERWRKAYFHRRGDRTYEVRAQLKQEVLFRPLNLIRPFPFRRPFHVIFCRNVMIYFDAAQREALVRRFYDALAPGGYLFIGQSESLQTDKGGFQYVMPAVYRK